MTSSQHTISMQARLFTTGDDTKHYCKERKETQCTTPRRVARQDTFTKIWSLAFVGHPPHINCDLQLQHLPLRW